MRRTAYVRGILLELQDEDRETLDTVTKNFELKYLMSERNDVWAVHNTVINTSSEGTKFTVPVEIELPEEVLPYVKFFKASLIIDNRQKVWLGANFYTSSMGGVLLSATVNSLAYKAGLRTADVIVAINGEPVKSASEAEAIIDSMYEGDVVVLKLKDGREISVTLGARP